MAGAAERLETRVSRRATPRWDLRTAPIALFASWSTIDLSYRITPRFATGPAYVHYGCNGPGGMLTPCFGGNAFGWSWNYYVKPVTEPGLYFGGRGYLEKYGSHGHAMRYTVDRDGGRANVVAGVYSPGRKWGATQLTIHAGLGYEYGSYKQDYSADDPDDLPSTRADSNTFQSVALEFKVGLQF